METIDFRTLSGFQNQTLQLFLIKSRFLNCSGNPNPLELTSNGFTNSMEYSASFLGGTKGEWAYIVSVDFSNLDQFQSIAAVIKVSPTGSAIVKKIFSSAEIKDFIK